MRENLDKYIVVTPPDEDENYCPECGYDAGRCELPLEHAGLWITQSEHAQDMAEDMASEAWGER